MEDLRIEYFNIEDCIRFCFRCYKKCRFYDKEYNIFKNGRVQFKINCLKCTQRKQFTTEDECYLQDNDLFEIETFCYKCNKTTRFEDAEYKNTKSGKVLIKGYCSNCTKKKFCKTDYTYNLSKLRFACFTQN